MTTTRQTKQKYKQIILNHLLAGKSLSTYEAYDLYNITCFLQRVSELRDQGVTIQGRFLRATPLCCHLPRYNQPSRNRHGPTC